MNEKFCCEKMKEFSNFPSQDGYVHPIITFENNTFTISWENYDTTFVFIRCPFCGQILKEK